MACGGNSGGAPSSPSAARFAPAAVIIVLDRPRLNRPARCFTGHQPFVRAVPRQCAVAARSEEHTSELQSRGHLVCRLLLEKKNLQTWVMNNIEHKQDEVAGGMLKY